MCFSPSCNLVANTPFLLRATLSSNSSTPFLLKKNPDQILLQEASLTLVYNLLSLMSVAFPFCALQLMALSVHRRVAILLNKRCNVFSLCGPVGSRVLACNLEAYICIFLSLSLINFILRLLFVLQTSCNWACLLSLG